MHFSSLFLTLSVHFTYKIKVISSNVCNKVTFKSYGWRCRFQIWVYCVSNFLPSVDVTYAKTVFLIHWSERDVLWVTMPMSFRKFCRNCCVTIDCSEIECLTHLKAKAQMWSNFIQTLLHSEVFNWNYTSKNCFMYFTMCWRKDEWWGDNREEMD